VLPSSVTDITKPEGPVLYIRIYESDYYLIFPEFTPFHFPPRGKGIYAGAIKKVLFNRRVRKAGAKRAKLKHCYSVLCDLSVKATPAVWPLR